jgi:hypothetical protein
MIITIIVVIILAVEIILAVSKNDTVMQAYAAL